MEIIGKPVYTSDIFLTDIDLQKGYTLIKIDCVCSIDRSTMEKRSILIKLNDHDFSNFMHINDKHPLEPLQIFVKDQLMEIRRESIYHDQKVVSSDDYFGLWNATVLLKLRPIYKRLLIEAIEIVLHSRYYLTESDKGKI